MTKSLNKNKISIIVCVKNGMPFLKDTIKSIFKQKYPNLELIVCYDASKDGSEKYLLSKKKKINILFKQKNPGNRYSAVNESIKKDFPLIQIEHDGKNSKSLEVINFLQSLGYKYFYARESKVPSPIQSILGSVGFWPKLIMINKVKPKFYQAIWLSTIDLKI